jgi:beta-lactamase regulating signal transducer with metallopeptidase domain
VEVWHRGAILKRLKDWQIIGKILSIIWLLGAVVFSTKTVGEERLKFRVLWHETCLISNELRAETLQKHKNLDKKMTSVL